MTRRECDRRVAALKARYADLVAGPHIGHRIAPGWLGLVERLCAGIDGGLAEAERPGVDFRQITEEYGGLRGDLSISPLRPDMTAPPGRALSLFFWTLRKPRPEGALFHRIE